MSMEISMESMIYSRMMMIILLQNEWRRKCKEDDGVESAKVDWERREQPPGRWKVRGYEDNQVWDEI